MSWTAIPTSTDHTDIPDKDDFNAWIKENLLYLKALADRIGVWTVGTLGSSPNATGKLLLVSGSVTAVGSASPSVTVPVNAAYHTTATDFGMIPVGWYFTGSGATHEL